MAKSDYMRPVTRGLKQAYTRRALTGGSDEAKTPIAWVIGALEQAIGSPLNRTPATIRNAVSAFFGSLESSTQLGSLRAVLEPLTPDNPQYRAASLPDLKT